MLIKNHEKKEVHKKHNKKYYRSCCWSTWCCFFISCSNNSFKNNVSAAIPLPIKVVIDDVGWRLRKDGGEYQEPFRTGINRNRVIADYQAVIDLGKAFDIRPQAALILCECDRENILRNVPHSTWMADSWYNSQWVGPWLEETADIKNKENFEITMYSGIMTVDRGGDIFD